MVDVNVDDDARIDIGELKNKLTDCLKSKRAVYAVVAIIGSTEHGACDQLDEIISLRDDPEVSTCSSIFCPEPTQPLVEGPWLCTSCGRSLGCLFLLDSARLGQTFNSPGVCACHYSEAHDHQCSPKLKRL